MSLLTKHKTYSAGDTATPSDHNTLWDRLYNLFDGSTSTYRGHCKYSHATDPALKIEQAGAGDVLDILVAGVSKIKVNNTGQLVSSVASGNAPFTIASTDLVTNLNADQVDSLDAADIVQIAAGSPQELTDAILASIQPGTRVATSGPVTLTDEDNIILCQGSGDFDVNLILSSSFAGNASSTHGGWVTIVANNGVGNSITVKCQGADVMAGSYTQAVVPRGYYLTLVTHQGTTWYPMASGIWLASLGGHSGLTFS